MALNMKNVIRNNYTYLKDHLNVKGMVVDYLYQEKVLSKNLKDEIESCQVMSEQVDRLLHFMRRRPQKDFDVFLTALDKSEQSHIKGELLRTKTGRCSETTKKWVVDGVEEPFKFTGKGSVKERNENIGKSGTEVELMEDGNDEEEEEDMETIEEDEGEEDIEEEEEEEEEEGEEDIGEEEELSDESSKMLKIADFKKESSMKTMKKVSIHCKVMSTAKKQKKDGKVQFMAVVADSSSSVDCCVTNKDLFHLFKQGSGLILRKVQWSGRVLFVNRADTVKTAVPMDVPSRVMKEAFGTGSPISVSEALQLEDNTWFSVMGKVVKVSSLTRREMYEGKVLLTHRQVKLQDDSAAMDMNIWELLACKVKLGDVIKITSCKKTPRDDGPNMSTTQRSKLKKMKSSLYPEIHKDRRLQSGTLQSITVDTFQACPGTKCYHFKLSAKGHGMYCRSCDRSHDKQQNNYSEAKIDVLSPGGYLRQLVVFWPQLEELFGLFGKSISINEGSDKIKNSFLQLASEKKCVKYYACGNVHYFRLPKI